MSTSTSTVTPQNASSSKQSRYRTRDGIREKECLACGGWFPADDKHFYCWSGKLTSRCRCCMKEIVYMQRDNKKQPATSGTDLSAGRRSGRAWARRRLAEYLSTVSPGEAA